MTKQEQIEDMAKHICSVCDWMEASGCMKGDIDDYTQCSRTMETAEAIYKAGYRQIREKNEKRDDLKAEIKHLNTIVERLDELLAKGIDEYIMGRDGVEGLKDMWERAAVMEFAKKVKAKSYVNDHCREVVEIEKIDELLKEYE